MCYRPTTVTQRNCPFLVKNCAKLRVPLYARRSVFFYIIDAALREFKGGRWTGAYCDTAAFSGARFGNHKRVEIKIKRHKTKAKARVSLSKNGDTLPYNRSSIQNPFLLFVNKKLSQTRRRGPRRRVAEERRRFPGAARLERVGAGPGAPRLRQRKESKDGGCCRGRSVLGRFLSLSLPKQKAPAVGTSVRDGGIKKPRRCSVAAAARGKAP